MILITSYESYILLLGLNININQQSFVPVLIGSDSAFHSFHERSVEGLHPPPLLKLVRINMAERRRHLHMQVLIYPQLQQQNAPQGSDPFMETYCKVDGIYG